MKNILSILLSLSLLIAQSLSAAPYKVGVIEPIIFEIVGEDKVMVNGTAVSIKESWQVANEYIEGHTTNIYRVENGEKFPEQAARITANMKRVANITGVKILER